MDSAPDQHYHHPSTPEELAERETPRQAHEAEPTPPHVAQHVSVVIEPVHEEHI